MDKDFRMLWADVFYGANMKQQVLLSGYIKGTENKLQLYLVDMEFQNDTFTGFKITMKTDATIADHSLPATDFGNLNYASMRSLAIPGDSQQQQQVFGAVLVTPTRIKGFAYDMQFKKFDQIPPEAAMLKNLVPQLKINMPLPSPGTIAYIDVLINSLDPFSIHVAQRSQNDKKYSNLRIFNPITNSVATFDRTFTAVRLLYSKPSSSRNAGNSCFLVLESNQFSYYNYNLETKLVIDGSKVTNEEVTVTAKLFGNPDKKAEMKFKIEKVAGWQEKANITNLDFNRFTTFGEDNIELSLGGNILEGNAATVKATAEGLEDSKFAVRLSAKQAPAEIFTTFKNEFDGFFPMKDVRWGSKEQLYAAYKAGAAKDGKGLLMFFTCTWESGKQACTESTTRKSVKYPTELTPSNLAWYNESEVLIFFHSRLVFGLVGHRFQNTKAEESESTKIVNEFS